MSMCNGGIIKITNVPENLLSILKTEVEQWDYIKEKYSFDMVFGQHKAKSYHVKNISANITYPNSILPVINWVESIAGEDTKVVRCFLNLMEPHQNFNIHVDTLKVHVLAKRFHIPLTMSAECDYYTYEKTENGWVENIHSMEYGYLYQLDNIRPHNVKNKEGYRINFICDLISKDLITESLLSPDMKQVRILHDIFKYGLKIIH